MLPPSSSRTIMTTLSAGSGPGLRASFMSQASPPTVASAPRRTKVSNPLTLESAYPARLARRPARGRGIAERRFGRAAEQADPRPGGRSVAWIVICAHVDAASLAPRAVLSFKPRQR